MTGILKLHAESSRNSKQFEIDQLSVYSAHAVRFRTTSTIDGKNVHFASGFIWECKEVNELPPCPPECPGCGVNRNEVIPGKARRCNNCGIEWNDPLP
jgi:hypothetical protein